jgi:nucleoside phosphorylase
MFAESITRPSYPESRMYSQAASIFITTPADVAEDDWPVVYMGLMFNHGYYWERNYTYDEIKKKLSKAGTVYKTVALPMGTVD